MLLTISFFVISGSSNKSKTVSSAADYREAAGVPLMQLCPEYRILAAAAVPTTSFPLVSASAGEREPGQSKYGASG
jgi:hypothetical protein